MVEKHFYERTADGKCAVLFLPNNDNIVREARQNFVMVYLYDMKDSNIKCWFCVKKDCLPDGERVELGVHEIMLGRVVGKCGSNAKKISRALGRKFVTFYKV